MTETRRRKSPRSTPRLTAARRAGITPPTQRETDVVGQRLCARVRDLRKKRGWTLEQMSAACGVSRSMLSEIERHQANPTLAVAHRIAQALGMTLDELVETPGATPQIEVIRADDRSYHYRSDRLCSTRTLSPLHLEKDVEFYELLLRPGGALRSAPHYQGTREFITVQQGALRVISGADHDPMDADTSAEASELQRGDSAQYPADVPHAIENIGAGDAVAFLVVIYRNA